MAMYFHGQNPDIQTADGLQTLVLMNPAYLTDVPQSASPGNNLFFLNPGAGGPSSSPATTQQFVDVPLPSTTASLQNHQVHELCRDMNPGTHGFPPRVQYGVWNSLEPSWPHGRDASQGLSLSLSSQQQQVFVRRGFGDEREVQAVSGGSPSSVSGVTSGGGGGGGVAGVSVLLGSKYLKAAQELLSEVANVGSIIDVVKSDRSSKAGDGGSSASVKEDGSSSTAVRQEIQTKKAKLIAMLEEVDQRYRHYHHQIQIVISAFEQAAGIGSARTYTALALQTISEQFRCLKDTISYQIQASNSSLGEEETEGSRLKFIDHHIRQQRALHQLGAIQHNAWRPQRGLPERSVSVLRSWLFEHFLHPYPKDSDKLMLAMKTGLTRSQVSNWFINARVRLWKPMVKEMYMEEVKDQEHNGGNDEATKSSGLPELSASASVDNHRNNLILNQDSANPPPDDSISRSHHPFSGFSFIGSSELDGITQGASPKKPRNAALTADMLLGSSPTNSVGGFGQYPIPEIGRFGTEHHFATAFRGNGVSLTLGLHHSENLTMPGGTSTAVHPGFIPGQGIHPGRRVEEFGASSGLPPGCRRDFVTQ